MNSEREKLAIFPTAYPDHQISKLKKPIDVIMFKKKRKKMLLIIR